VTLPPIDSLEGLSLAELRGLVAALIGEVRSLQGRVASLEIENQALRAENEVLRAENPALRVENQALKDEIARLKNLPPPPPVKSTKPSGMEKATQPVTCCAPDLRRRPGSLWTTRRRATPIRTASPPRSAMTASPPFAPGNRSHVRRSWTPCVPGTAILSGMNRH